MPEPLPPELSRLGDEIVAAAETRLRARRRRTELLTRLATAGVVGGLLFAVLTPGPLGPADRAGLLRLAPAAPAAAPGQLTAMCDQPRRATFVSSGPCAGTSVVVLRRAHAWQ